MLLESSETLILQGIPEYNLLIFTFSFKIPIRQEFAEAYFLFLPHFPVFFETWK
jgi:hypothetical protein